MPIEDRDWYREETSVSKKVCPKCKSNKIYYNTQFSIWRCGSCEHSFVRPMYINKITDSEWWKGYFGETR